MLRNKLFACLLMLGGSAMAGYAYPVPPAGVQALPGGLVGFGGATASGTFSAGKMATNVVVQVAGSNVTVPASMRLAANAAQYAVAAARLNPAGLVTGALATWLLTAGLQYASNQWTKTGVAGYTVPWSASIWGTSSANNNAVQCSQETLETCVNGVVEAMQAAHNAGAGCGASCVTDYIFGQKDTGTKWTGTYPGSVTGYIFQYWTKTGANAWVFQSNYTVTISSGAFSRTPTEADWGLASSGSLSDAAANQIYPQVVLPVDVAINPDSNFRPQPYRVPTGSPESIGSGNYRQPVIDINPAPDAGVPYRVDLVPRWLENTSPTGLTAPESVTPTSEASKEPTTSLTLPCGTTGLPACAVKVDETGTPSGSADSALSTPKTAIEDAATSIGDKIGSPTAPTSLGWSFGAGLFGMPTGSCTEFEFGSRLGSISSDICDNALVNTVRAMLMWAMYAVTLLYVWRRANEFLERAHP